MNWMRENRASMIGQARHALEQHVPTGQQRDEQRVHQMFLAHDGLIHSLTDHIHKVASACNQVIQLPDIDCFCHNVNIVLSFIVLCLVFYRVQKYGIPPNSRLKITLI